MAVTQQTMWMGTCVFQPNQAPDCQQFLLLCCPCGAKFSLTSPCCCRRQFTDTAIGLSMVLLNAGIDLISFSGILYSIYPPLFVALLVCRTTRHHERSVAPGN